MRGSKAKAIRNFLKLMPVNVVGDSLPTCTYERKKGSDTVVLGNCKRKGYKNLKKAFKGVNKIWQS